MTTSTPRRALVTGASGHLGGNLVHELVADGWVVVPFVRVTSRLEGLVGLDLRLRYGDVLDRASLDAAMQGCDVVFHTAAVHRNWASDAELEIVHPIVDGTRNVIEAAAAAGVRRVVHTSSHSTVGFTTDGARPRSEADHADAPHMYYIRAKVESERLALRLGRELAIEVVVLNPTSMLGPRDYGLTPTSAFVRDVFLGGPVLPGVQNIVHVRDAARAHVLAAERGEPGERYIVGGANMRHEDFIRFVHALTGKRPSVLQGPRWLFLLVSWVMETVARARGGEPPLTPAMVMDAHGRSAAYDTSKASAVLGFEARGPREVLEDTLLWLDRSGRLV